MEKLIFKYLGNGLGDGLLGNNSKRSKKNFAQIINRNLYKAKKPSR